MSRVIKADSPQNTVSEYGFGIVFYTEEEQAAEEVAHEEESVKPEEEPQEEEQDRAEILYQQSLEQAEQILDQARQEGERIKAEAFEAGRKEGYEAGKEEGAAAAYKDVQKTYEKHIEDLRETISDYVGDMELAKEKVLETYVDDLKNISLAVAEKVILTSLKASGEIVKRMIISATDKLKKVAWAKIFVGKNDHGMTIKGDADLIHELANLSDNIKIVVMESEEPGTCIVELPNEIIDVSVSTQLENIKDILNNARN